MPETFELLDPANARQYLQKSPREIERAGERLFRKGLVNLHPEEPGVHYSAKVDGSDVHLIYDVVDGWSSECSCDEDANCAHAFAAMRALLVEHGSAAVRNLSAGISRVSDKRRGPNEPSADKSYLARRLMTAIGRPLNSTETAFIRRIEDVYKRCLQNKYITHWDFEQMGLRLGGYGWDTIHIWPSLPANDYEFWLYVANAALQHKVRIPGFMEPVTDLGDVEARLKNWQRLKEVDRWKQLLTSFSTRPPSTAASSEMDLRLMIGSNEAVLQWRSSPSVNFQNMKAGHFQQLTHSRDGRHAHFTPGSELLWNFFAQQQYGESTHLRYYDDAAMDVLRRILRHPALEQHVVDRNGRPLVRSSEPLRWALEPAASENEDYRLRLVESDGSAAPTVLCVLPGQPALFLTEQGVFPGPAGDEVLDPAEECRIPAPAIETPEGVGFLQALGLELPERLRGQVVTLLFNVVINCRLVAPSFGTSEECIFHIVAETPDGLQQTWNGFEWFDTSPKGARKKSGSNRTITLHDRRRLDLIPGLMAPLGLRQNYQGRLAVRVTRKFPEHFAVWLKTIPPEMTVQLTGELASFANADVAGEVKLDVTEAEIDWFDLRVVLNVSDTTLTQEEIKLLLNARGGYVRLAGKGWRRLHFALTEDENERLARLGLSPRGLSAEPQRLHALQLADEAAKKFLPAQQVDQIQKRVTDIKARVTPDLPAGVTAQLRPYQLDGFHFLAYLATNRFGGILADDMGLGKTLQALAWLLWIRETPVSKKANAALPSLVVCPKSVMDNWHAEAQRFTPGLKVKAWAANELDNFGDGLAQADLHVINYSQLRLLGESLVPLRWQVLILDEGQYIKNPGSQTAQVARALHAQHRLVLSGTPIENRLLDLWSLMAFAMPGVLGSRAQFARLYDAKGDPFARRRLSSRVRPFLLRRTKSQVAKDLPDRIEEDLYCEIEGEQKTLYRAELKRAQQLLLKVHTQKELANQQFHFLTSLLRLRQICCHPRLVNAETEASSAKSDALLEQLEPLMDEGHKVLVFSQFVELLNLIRPAIAQRGWPVFYLAGETENRGELVRQFQSAEGAAVFLISLKAGGFGLNLTAASYVVLFDPWWNPAVENQAIDRTHRIGQVNKVIAYRLLIKDSIEEKIRLLQKQKRALAEDVLGEEKFSQSLTLEDLRFLLAD